MPRVPTYGARRVEPAALPGARVLTDAPSNTFAGPVDTAPASAIVSEVAQKAALDADEIAVNQAKVATINQQAKDLQDPQTGVLNMKGINALGALPEWQQRHQKMTEDISGSLQNDRQRAMYAKFAQNQYNEGLNEVTAHTRAEYNKADIASSNSLLDNGLAMVTGAPERAPEAITAARRELIAFGGRQGWSDEVKRQKAAVHVSDIHAAAISSLIQRGTYEAAQQAETYLKANRGELRGGQLDDAEKQVDTALGDSAGEDQARDILGLNKNSAVLPSVGQQQGEVTPQGTTQQPVAKSREQMFREAQALPDKRARKAATEYIESYFTKLDRMQHLDRQDALARVVAQVEASGGRLNRGSPDYQKLIGHPEETHALSAQDRILRPPKDPGDPELFMSHLNMATISSASREHFLQFDFTGKDGKGLNTSQRTRLIQMQGQFRGQDTKHDATDAVAAEKLRFERESELLKIGDPASSHYIADKAERDTEVARIKRHYNQLQEARGVEAPPAPSVVQRQQGSAPAGNVTLAHDEPVQRREATPQMIEDVQRKGPKYAAYLQSLGVVIPPIPPRASP